MTLSLNLPPDLEASARALASAKGEDLEAFLLRQLATTLHPKTQAAHHKLSDRFEDRLHQWANLHPEVGNMDDSRASIYMDR